ncbi:MAG: hypothetical protein V1850_02410, partial [Candidatus Bathyarchaeota archaeon]
MGGIGNPLGGVGPPLSTGTITDNYLMNVGIQTNEAQQSMDALARQFRDFADTSNQGVSMLNRGLGQLAGAARLFGVSFGFNYIGENFLRVDQMMHDFQKTLYDVQMQTQLGGGVLLSWAQMNQEAWQIFTDTTNQAFEKWRRTPQEITQLYQAVAQAGIGAGRDLAESMREASEAVTLGFQLQMLGMSTQQIQSMFHSMAINLRMDMDEIKESFMKTHLIAQDTGFSWLEHIGYVERALAQYSKFGITLDQVNGTLIAMITETKTLGDEFQKVGVVYDALMNQLGVRRQLTPTQAATLLITLGPEGLERSINVGGPEARSEFEKRFQRFQRGMLPPGMEISTEQLIKGGVDPAYYTIAFQALNEGMMTAAQLLTTSKLMTQQGEGGMRNLFLFAERFPWLTGPIMDLYRAGHPDAGNIPKLLEMFAPLAAATSKIPDKLFGPEGPISADKWWTQVGDVQERLVDNITGLREDVKFQLERIWRLMLSGEVRGARARQELEVTSEARSYNVNAIRDAFVSGAADDATKRFIGQLGIPGLETQLGTPEGMARATTTISYFLLSQLQKTPTGDFMIPWTKIIEEGKLTAGTGKDKRTISLLALLETYLALSQTTQKGALAENIPEDLLNPEMAEDIIDIWGIAYAQNFKSR